MVIRTSSRLPGKTLPHGRIPHRKLSKQIAKTPQRVQDSVLHNWDGGRIHLPINFATMAAFLLRQRAPLNLHATPTLPTKKQHSIMSSTISFPTIEGGSHAHGFLARALAVTGVPVPPSGDPFFPSRETRTLQPFPANVVGAEHADHFQDSVRDLLIQAGDDWKFLSLFGVHNSHVSGSVQPTLLIVLQPNSATVDRAMAMVGEVFAIQQR